jgi:hypothetical protein
VPIPAGDFCRALSVSEDACCLSVTVPKGFSVELSFPAGASSLSMPVPTGASCRTMYFPAGACCLSVSVPTGASCRTM